MLLLTNRERERERGEKGERGNGVKFLSRQEGWDPCPEWRDSLLIGRGTLRYIECAGKMRADKDCLGNGKPTKHQLDGVCFLHGV